MGSPRHLRFSMAYNNGPHSGSTTHLALSDKWFWKRTHAAPCPAWRPRAQTLHCLLLYSISVSVRMIFSSISLTSDTMYLTPAWVHLLAVVYEKESRQRFIQHILKSWDKKDLRKTSIKEAAEAKISYLVVSSMGQASRKLIPTFPLMQLDSIVH